MKQQRVYRTPKGYYYRVNKNSKSVRISKQEFQDFKNLKCEPLKLTSDINAQNSCDSILMKAAELNHPKFRINIF